MRLENQFVVPVSVDRTWDLLQDLETIAPCLPGAQVEGVDGDDYKGVVKVKLGPVTIAYRGTVAFADRDPRQRVAVLKAAARETRGSGTVSATITASLHEESATGTRVQVDTDLAISGRAAQFGRGVLADVSGRIFDQFADRLSQMLAADTQAPAAGGTGGAGTTTPVGLVAPPPEPEPLAITSIVPVRRVAVILGGAVLTVAVLVRLRRRVRAR